MSTTDPHPVEESGSSQKSGSAPEQEVKLWLLAFHSSLNTCLRKMPGPTGPCLPGHHRSPEHVRMHLPLPPPPPPTAGEQRAGCGVPACSTFTFPRSQPGFCAVRTGAGISCHPSRDRQWPPCHLSNSHDARGRDGVSLQGLLATASPSLWKSSSVQAFCRPANSVNIYWRG